MINEGIKQGKKLANRPHIRIRLSYHNELGPRAPTPHLGFIKEVTYTININSFNNKNLETKASKRVYQVLRILTPSSNTQNHSRTPPPLLRVGEGTT